MKFELKNRRNLKVVGIVETPEDPTGLAFIAHGQGGYKEQPHIQAFKTAFLENGFTVVLFDATHSIGESEGDIENVTQTGYLQDLEDVINWAKEQQWYQKPFALCGHSMGGMSVTLYAEQHPKDVLALVPASPVVNHDLAIKNVGHVFLKAWEAKGYFESESASKPGAVKRVGWGYVEDLKGHNLLSGAGALTMPILILVGDNDKATPLSNQQILFRAIPSVSKKIIVIKDADHNFRGAGSYGEKLEEVKNLISSWLKEL